MQKILKFFDKLEDSVRGKLSENPLVYALIGGIGVVLFWRGVWHTADTFLFLTGPVSLVLGTVILLLTGVFVSSFVGNSLLMSGLKREKKLTEKTREEVQTEETEIQHIEKVLHGIEHELKDIKEEIHSQTKK